MVDVDALEVVAQPGQLGETRIAQRPVGQQTRDGWEDVERVAATQRIA